MRRAMAVVVGLMLVAAACSGDDSDSDSAGGSPDGGDEPTYLFVIDAESGSVDGDTITLSGVDGSVLQFTDRPYREVGYVDLGDFAQSWSADGFSDDPPDAAISWVVDGETQSTAVELTSLEVDGDSATLTYTSLDDTTLLGGEQSTSLPDEIADVSVVIDSAGSATESQVIALDVEGTTSESVTVAYSGLAGNQPFTNDNTLYVWEGASVAWDGSPVATQAIETNTTSGTVTISGLTPETTTYTIGYAVGDSPSLVASTVTTAPEDPEADSTATGVSIEFVEANSIVVSYELPAGADPSAGGHWLGVWESSSIDPSGGIEPMAKAEVTGSSSEGSAEVNLEVLRGTAYSVGYFVGSGRSELAATTTFVG